MPTTGRVAALLGGVALAMGIWGAASAQGTTGAPAPGAPAGTYLAARAAALSSDFAAAARLLAQALREDGDDLWLLESALVANLSLGRMDDARALADTALAAGLRSPIAHLALDIAHAMDRDWRGLLRELEAGHGVGPLVDGLSRGWAWQGVGEPDRALSAFDELAGAPGLRTFGLYHKALALALQGDLEGADELLSLPPSQGIAPTRRAVLAHVEVLSALGRNADALALLDDSVPADLDAALLDIRDRLEEGGTLPFTFVTSAAEGLSEAYLNVAATLADGEPQTALLYARASLALDPGRSEAALLAATLLQELGQPRLAREAFALVPEGDPSFLAAELGRAGVLQAEGEPQAALEVLSGLARGVPDRPEVASAQGDLLRVSDRWEEAEEAYDRAIALSPPGSGTLWYLHFTRALAREARKDWPGTEADLRRSLELRPDSPQVLNHLGYGLVERGEKFPEALELLQRAVALRPDSGAIVDSLGWAFFKLGRQREAVETLERAVSLLPHDPVVNDHLGDAYWMVGRLREARFQWSRALSFEPTPEEAGRIRDKLVHGLEAGAAAPAETAALPGGAGGG